MSTPLTTFWILNEDSEYTGKKFTMNGKGVVKADNSEYDLRMAVLLTVKAMWVHAEDPRWRIGDFLSLLNSRFVEMLMFLC